MNPPHPTLLPRGLTSLGLAGCLHPTALTQTPTQHQNSTKKRVSLQGCHPLRCFASACRRIASMRQFCFDREVTSPEAVKKKLWEVYPTQRLRGPKKVVDAEERNMTRNRDHVRTFRLACLGPLLQTQKQHKLKTQSSLGQTVQVPRVYSLAQHSSGAELHKIQWFQKEAKHAGAPCMLCCQLKLWIAKNYGCNWANHTCICSNVGAFSKKGLNIGLLWSSF